MLVMLFQAEGGIREKRAECRRRREMWIRARMRPEPGGEALDEGLADGGTLVVPMPSGRPLTQAVARELATREHLVCACGRYEGIDQRAINQLVDDEISIGDYVLTNGALAAAVFVHAIARLLPCVLGDAASARDESHASGLLEFPQYTRPVEFCGLRVPDIRL